MKSNLNKVKLQIQALQEDEKRLNAPLAAYLPQALEVLVDGAIELLLEYRIFGANPGTAAYSASIEFKDAKDLSNDEVVMIVTEFSQKDSTPPQEAIGRKMDQAEMDEIASRPKAAAMLAHFRSLRTVETAGVRESITELTLVLGQLIEKKAAKDKAGTMLETRLKATHESYKVLRADVEVMTEELEGKDSSY